MEAGVPAGGPHVGARIPLWVQGIPKWVQRVPIWVEQAPYRCWGPSPGSLGRCWGPYTVERVPIQMGGSLYGCRGSLYGYGGTYMGAGVPGVPTWLLGPYIGVGVPIRLQGPL